MSTDERLERLERRVAVLEGLVRTSLRGGAAEPAAVREEVEARPVAVPPRAAPPRVVSIDERWIGQRGLLAVGVVALLMATGYLLKLSFERGWIPPVMRCVGGALLGAAVGAIRWRPHESCPPA